MFNRRSSFLRRNLKILLMRNLLHMSLWLGIENCLYMLRSDFFSGVFDKGDNLILFGDEEDFIGVALRKGRQLLDTVRKCKDLHFRTDVKTDIT